MVTNIPSPDGHEFAVRISSPSSIHAESVFTLPDAWTVSFWIQNPESSPSLFIEFGDGVGISFEDVAGDRSLFFDGYYLVPFTAEGWHHIAIVRFAGALSVFIDGEVVGSPVIWSGVLAGPVTFAPAVSSVDLFDFCVKPVAVSEAALRFYFEDVTIQHGRQTLPLV